MDGEIAQPAARETVVKSEVRCLVSGGSATRGGRGVSDCEVEAKQRARNMKERTGEC
jgi:hypothetical protein